MKKSILILTDFSDEAMQAAEVATILAGQLSTNLVLLYCDNTISAVAYYPLAPVMTASQTWQEDIKSKLNEISAHLKEKFRGAFPSKHLPVVKTVIEEGELTASLPAVLQNHPIEMIVMGASSGSSTEHFLFGSDIKSVVDHSSLPLLIIPRTKTLRPTIQITFATNFLEQDIQALNFLAKFRRRLGAHLEIVHIREYGKVQGLKNEEVRQAIIDLRKTSIPLVVYNEVYGKHVTSRLSHYVRDNDSDMLALSHEHHSLLFRIFNEGMVDKTISIHRIPILVIPKLEPDAHK